MVNVFTATSYDSWTKRAKQFEMPSYAFHMDTFNLIVMPLNDTPLTVERSLAGVRNWMDYLLSPLDPYSPIRGGSSMSQHGLAAAKSFALSGSREDELLSPLIVHPIPARAYRTSKAAYQSSIEWLSASMSDIKVGEWTLLILYLRKTGNGPDDHRWTFNEIRYAWISRDESGDLMVADQGSVLGETMTIPILKDAQPKLIAKEEMSDLLTALERAKEAEDQHAQGMCEEMRMIYRQQYGGNK